MNIQYKQLVVVPKSLKMSAGKMASQVAHATFMALENQRNGCMENMVINFWKKEGMCVIVLECATPTQLLGIAEYCKQWKVPHHLYIDEGLTEVEMGTPTAFATGVLDESEWWMFETLKLYTEDSKRKK